MAVKQLRNAPIISRVGRAEATGSAQPAQSLERWFEDVGDLLQSLDNEISGLTDVDTSATLAELITAHNALLAALRRAVR